MKSKTIFASAIILIFVIGGYFFIDSLLFDGVKPKSIHTETFQGTYFAKDDLDSQPAVVLIGGGDWGNYWGQEFAKANYVGLSLPYYRLEGLPDRMEEIPLEYFEGALRWLSRQPGVHPEKIIVMGASRNAELALVIASYYPTIVRGAIAYSPSSVSWSNTVLPFNSDSIRPSWTIDNEPVAFIPMEKLRGGESDTMEMLSYWSTALQDSSVVANASIPVEKINGPILLFSGLQDEVWPSAMMSDMIENRLMERQFTSKLDNIKYANAGHLVSGNPNNVSSTRNGQLMIDGELYYFYFGGTADGDRAAQIDAASRVFQFLSEL